MVSRSRMSIDGVDGLLAGDGRASSATASARLAIAVGDDDVRAALGGEQRDLAADAAASADDQHDAAAEFFLGRLAADLGFLKRPVLDAEGLAGGQGDVVVDGLELVGGRRRGRPAECRCTTSPVAERARALHDADGVGVELAGDARLGLVLAEAEHADAGNEHDGGAGVAHGGRVGQGVGLVVLGVLGAIGLQRHVDQLRRVRRDRRRGPT